MLLEAMACGTPVVSTAYMGTADIVKPERGARVAPDNEDGFANLVVELLDDPARRRAMSAEARALCRYLVSGRDGRAHGRAAVLLLLPTPKQLAA